MGFGGGGGGESQQVQTSSGGTSTQIVKSEPWGELIPYIQRGLQETKKAFLDTEPPKLYPEQLTIPFPSETETSLQLRTLRALNGSPFQRLAGDELGKTLGSNYLENDRTIRGDFLVNGPGFDSALDAATRRILPKVDSEFEKSGRFNSGLAQTAKTQAIGDAFSLLYDQERNRQVNQVSNERENMMRGLLFTPQMNAMEYLDFDQLGGVGDARRGLAGELKDEARTRYEYGQNIWQNQVAQYMNLLQGTAAFGGGSSSTTTTTPPGMMMNSGSTSGGGSGFNIGKGASNAFSNYAALSAVPSLGISPWLGAGAGLLSAFNL